MHMALGRARADTIILEAQFFFTPDTSFAIAARDTMFAARLLFGRTVAREVRSALEGRGMF
jgi:hypothetical protein